jgi:hypothetical protein
MGAEKIQFDIDLLLTYMNDDMESFGGTINSVYFSFVVGQTDRTAIDEKLNWPEDHLYKIINTCNSRSLLKNTNGFAHIFLTEEGQSRAISVKHGKNRSYELGTG